VGNQPGNKDKRQRDGVGAQRRVLVSWVPSLSPPETQTVTAFAGRVTFSHVIVLISEFAGTHEFVSGALACTTSTEFCSNNLRPSLVPKFFVKEQ
jgi:hypothetical protein